MKGFIEVSTVDGKRSINVSKIVSIIINVSIRDGVVTSIELDTHRNINHYIKVKESYEQVKLLIKESN